MATHDESLAPPIGRSAELERLESHLAGTAAGERRAVLLLGPPGIGKTTLLRWCAARARKEGLATASVRVPGGAGLPPRYPIGDVLSGLVDSCRKLGLDAPDSLTRAATALQRRDPASPFPIALPQVAEAIEDVGLRVPVAVLIDDYHAAPPDGMELLLSALRVIEAPLLFVATARLRGEGEQGCPLPEPTADLWIEHLRLDGMSVEELATLLARELGGPALPTLAEAVHARTLGNSLFVVELARAWAQDGLLERAGAYWGIAADPGEVLPGTLNELISARVARLGDSLAAVAGVLAAVGRDTSFEECRAMAGLDDEALVAALSGLEDLGFVARAETRAYRLAHPMYGAALLRRMGSTREAALHQKVHRGLRSLRESVPSITATELAHHAVRSIERPPELRDLIIEAAREADAVRSYEEVARWYGHLAEESRDDPALRVEALQRQGDATANMDPRAAIPIFDRGLHLATAPADIVRLLIGRATARRRTGEFDEALEDLNRALDLAEGEDRVRARLITASIAGIRGDLDSAERILKELVDYAQDPDNLADIYSDLGMVASERGDLEGALSSIDRGRAAGSSPLPLPHLAQNEGWLRAVRGEWALAESVLKEGLSLARAAGNVWDHVFVECNMGILRAWQGRFAQAYDHCLSAQRSAARIRRTYPALDALDALGAVHLEAGAVEDALRILSRAAGLLDSDIESYETAVTVANLAEACRRLDDLESAFGWLDEADRRGVKPPFWRIKVERVRAACLLDSGEPRRARDVIVAALADPAAVNPFERAHCDEVLARIAATEGSPEEAARHLESARSVYEALGSPHSAARCIVPARKPRGRPPVPRVGGLTPRELDVATHVAQGLTDREIARALGTSDRTVSKHVSNILAKLGAKRRTQIATYFLVKEAGRGEPRGGPSQRP